MSKRSPQRSEYSAAHRSSQYEGVAWSELHAKWVAYIIENGHYVDLGLFQIEEDAARAVETAEFVSSCSSNAEDSPHSYTHNWYFTQPLKRAKSCDESHSDSDHASGHNYTIPQTRINVPGTEAAQSCPPSPTDVRVNTVTQTSPKQRGKQRSSRPASASSTQERGSSSEEHAGENVKHKKQQSQFVGVSWHKYVKKWQSFIRINGKTVFLGYHRSEAEAARAYDVAVIKHRGPNSTTNFDISHYQAEIAALPAPPSPPAAEPAAQQQPAQLPPLPPPKPLVIPPLAAPAPLPQPATAAAAQQLQGSCLDMGNDDDSAGSDGSVHAALDLESSDGVFRFSKAGGSIERTSRFRGVSWSKHCQKWRVQCCNNGRRVQVGYFDSEEEAARQYDRAAAEIQGLAAQTNFGYVHPCLFKGVPTA